MESLPLDIQEFIFKKYFVHHVLPDFQQYLHNSEKELVKRSFVQQSKKDYAFDYRFHCHYYYPKLLNMKYGVIVVNSRNPLSVQEHVEFNDDDYYGYLYYDT